VAQGLGDRWGVASGETAARPEQGVVREGSAGP
jgi:hypothetical protein